MTDTTNTIESVDLDKYRLREDAYNIILEKWFDGGKQPVTGKVGKGKWVSEGFYSKRPKARAHIYHKLIGEGLITGDEAIDMKQHLKVIEDTSAKIIEWFEAQDV